MTRLALALLLCSTTACAFLDAYTHATPSERERCEAGGGTWRETERWTDGTLAVVQECER